MVKLNYLVLLLLYSAVCFSQKPYDFKKAETDCRRLVYSNPDSARIIIQKTLSQKNITDSIYGNTYNMLGIYYGMKGIPDSTVFYSKKSLSYLENFPRNKARSLSNIAIGYRMMNEYDLALKYLNQALDIHKKENNQIGIAMAYGEIASIYYSKAEYEKAADLLLKSIAILKVEKSPKQLIAIKQKLANTYLVMHNFKFAIDLYRECIAEFKAAGQTKNYYLTLSNIAEAYMQLEDWPNARKALIEATPGLEKAGDKEMIGINYAKLGKLENELGNDAQSEKYYDLALSNIRISNSGFIVRIGSEYINVLNEYKKYDKALKIIDILKSSKKFNATNLEDRKIYQNAIADTYKGAHKNDDALEAYKHTIVLMDSISAQDKQSALDEIQAKFQTELQREKNLVLQANNNALQKNMKADKRLMLIYIVISIGLLIVVLLFVRGLRLKNRLQAQGLKSIEAEKNLIVQQHEYEQQLITKQEEIIDEKQRELTSSALRMANLQDSINEIIDKCDTAGLKATDIKKELVTLTKQNDYWKQFEIRFNTLHPEFGNNLTTKFSKLTKNDIEFCSLLKLNLSNKEIASLLQISHESAITKKYRIKKKMEINDDTEFEKLLMEI